MKKIILGIALCTIGTIGLRAQGPSGVVIQLNGSGSNLAGLAHEVTVSDQDLGGGVLYLHFIVTNNNTTDRQWQITRKKISVPSTWVDQVCWPPTCYFPSSLADPFTTPNTMGNPAPTILSMTSTAVTSSGNVSAELKPGFDVDDLNNGFGHYRYYINENGQYIDSVDVKVNFTLGISSLKQNLSMTISPNPASDVLNVSLASLDNANLKVVDVLGNVVLNETISNGSKNVDVSSFKNGVYFVMVETPGIKPMNRKLIIRH
jgi:hypothetical protein